MLKVFIDANKEPLFFKTEYYLFLSFLILYFYQVSKDISLFQTKDIKSEDYVQEFHYERMCFTRLQWQNQWKQFMTLFLTPGLSF